MSSLEEQEVNQEEVTSNGRRKSCCSLPFSCKDGLVTKWAEGSTIHGMDHVFTGKSIIRRILWSFIVLGAIAGCLYTIIDRSIYFHSKPTATTVKADTIEEGVVFPSVTVCNLSPIKRSYAESRNISSFLHYFIYTDTLLTEFRAEETCHTLLNDSSFTDPASLGLTLRDIFVNGSFKNDGQFPFIQSCYFGATRDAINCIGNLQPTLTPSGLCYTFNGVTDSTDRRIRSVGERYGLRMILNISQSEYLQSINADAGIKIVVHDPHEFPQPQETGISVYPGSHAAVILFPHSSTTRPEISNCNPLNTNLEFFSSRSYSMSTCKLNEYFKKSIELCGCTDIATDIPTSGQYSNARNCTIADACCLYDAFIANDQESVSKCLPACEDIFYEPSTSYSQFPSNRAADLISMFSGIETTALESNIIAVNVYFGSLQTITSVTDYSYGVSALIVDIGGALALFVGASVISFIEILFLCLDEGKRSAVYGKGKVVEKAKKAKEEHEMKTIREEKDEEKQSVV